MAIKKEHKKVLLTSLVPVALSLLFFFIYKLPFAHDMEAKTLDARFKLATKNLGTNKDVVVLLIDEASLQSMEPLVGRWPWNRAIYGELIDFLTQAGAKAVLFDVLFTEPQVPRDQNGELGEADQTLVTASASSANAHHAFVIIMDVEDEVNKSLINKPLPAPFVENFSLKNVTSTKSMPEYNNYFLPIKELWENTHSMGVVEFSGDRDGVYRSTHLLRPYQGNFYPVLSMSGILENHKGEKIHLADEKIQIGKLEVPLLWEGKYLINMKRDFNNYSIGGVFATIQKLNKGETDKLIVNPEEFKDKIILLGASAVGVDDLKMTATGKDVPGVYLHASVISNFLDRDFVTQFSPALTLLIFAIINITLGILIIGGQNLTAPLIVFFVALLGHLGVSWFVFNEWRVWVLVFAPLACLGLNFLILFIVKSFTEGKEKKFLRQAFSNYISPELIEIMYQSGEAPKLGGDVGRRTAYFTDIQGFSTFSEKLTAPKLVELLNEYLTVMTDILIEERGTLDKYEGDAIIAFYGAPMHLPDHAERAVRTALRMQNELGKLREKWRSEGDKWPKIVHDMRMRIGINTGEIVTGNMGSKMRMNYTMMGDAVNLAARLEESAKQYGIFIQISHFTHGEVKESFLCRELDTLRVVGKSEPITTYEPLMEISGTDELLRKLKAEFETGLTLYKAQKWDEAIASFERSLKLENERFPELSHKPNPSKIYIERCQEFKSQPPGEGWDGVYNLTHK